MAEALETLMRRSAAESAAIDLGDGIFASQACANSYLVTTARGDVLINTNLPHEAATTKSRFAAVSPGPLRYIVFTQGRLHGARAR